jgi:uncharacterized protein (DUF1330 family)
MPAGYVIARSFTADRQDQDRSRGILGRLIAAYQGRYVIRTADVETLVGDSTPFSLTIVRFPTLAAVDQLATSPELGAISGDLDIYGSVEAWGVPEVDTPPPAPTVPGPRGYLLVRATVSGVRRLTRPGDKLDNLVAEAGGRIPIRTGKVLLLGKKVPTEWITLIEMPTMAALRAALPDPVASDTSALWRSMGVEDVWIATGVG